MLTRPVLLLTASVAVIGSNSLALSPLASTVAASFAGVEAAGVMVAAAVYGLGTAVSALALAPLADRIGAQRALVHALAALAAGLAVSAAAPAFWMLCLGQALAGLAAGAALPAAYGLSAQIAPAGRESETLGLVLAGWTISMVAGVSLSALLADLVHWRGVFVTLAGLAAGVMFAIRQAPEWGVGSVTGAATSPLTALRVPGIGRGLLVCVAYMIAFYGLYSYLGAHLQGALGRSTAASGLAPLAYGLGFGAAVPIDRMLDRHGPQRLRPVVFAALSLVYLALAVAAGSFMLLIALCLVWGVVNHLGLNLIVGRLTTLDPRQRGAILGLNSAVTYLSVFAAALLYRPVFDQAGLAVCALVSAGCVALTLADRGRAPGHAAAGERAAGR